MTVIYVWPRQLGLRQQRYTVSDPIQVSRSMLTGKRYVSAHARRRRVVEFEVSVRKRHGYGVMEALIALLRGGVNLVRLNWAAPTDITGGRGAAGVWDNNWDQLWSSISGQVTVGALPPSATLTGLVPNQTVARAGEFIGIGSEVRTLIADVVSSNTGTARAVAEKAFTQSGPVTLPAMRTGVFEVTQIPEVPWTWNSETSVNWSFREVFLDEIGKHREIAPWAY